MGVVRLFRTRVLLFFSKEGCFLHPDSDWLKKLAPSFLFMNSFGPLEDIFGLCYGLAEEGK